MSVKVKLLAFIAGAAMPCLLSVAVAAEETFSKTIIQMPPGQSLDSFDIGFVDSDISKYVLADRTNKAIDVIDTQTNTFIRELTGCGGDVKPIPSCSLFVGVQSGSDRSGPNGALIVDHREVWAPDGVSATSLTSKVYVIDIATNAKIAEIDTGGNHRADELCEDVNHETVLVANDHDTDNFLTFINSETYTKIGSRLSLDGSDPNGQIDLIPAPAPGAKVAADGIEQCKFDPRTKKYYLAIPATKVTVGTSSTAGPGVVLVISRDAPFHVERTITIDPATGCTGPQGLTIGPGHEIALGCGRPSTNSLIIDEHQQGLATTANSKVLADTGGADEAWYNPGDNQYFIAASNHAPTAILGVADPSGQVDTPIPTAAGSHSVAADMLTNRIYVPGNIASGTTLCGTVANPNNGCIAVFHSDNDDACLSKGMPVLDLDDDDDPVFMRTPCGHENQGH